MQINSEIIDDTLVLTPMEKRLDAAVAATFKDSMREACKDRTGRVVLVMDRVEFVDSSGLGALVAAMKHVSQNGRLELAAPSENVSKLLKLTRMDTVFSVHQTREAALPGIKRAS